LSKPAASVVGDFKLSRKVQHLAGEEFDFKDVPECAPE
jgi:hypothetical protein